MKLVVMYRPESEFSSAVESFINDFKRRHEGVGRRIEVLNADTRDGMATMSLYDIMQQPAIMVLADDGHQLQIWIGPVMPPMDEVVAYFYTSQV